MARLLARFDLHQLVRCGLGRHRLVAPGAAQSHGFRLGQRRAGLVRMGLHHLQSGALQKHFGIDAHRCCRCHGFPSGHGFHGLGDRVRTRCDRLFRCSGPFFEARLIFAHLRQVHLAFPCAQLLRIRRLRAIVRDMHVGFMLADGQAR